MFGLRPRRMVGLTPLLTTALMVAAGLGTVVAGPRSDSQPKRGQASRDTDRDDTPWWSLQPPRTVVAPDVADTSWPKGPVDRFILSHLEQRQLQPATDADGRTMLRRLSFVLTGLPPSPQQVETFPVRFARDADSALTSLVDELLQSPHYGERMARHWMDVVRYSDTFGYEWDNPAKGSWEYRDYLIRAFNADIGFDQLIHEQIAGDLLKNARIDESRHINESLIGPAFYHLGEHRHGDNLVINGVREEMIDNKVDAFSKAFLATTVACARCHDHKLDPVSQRDYYALAAVFMTPRWTTRLLDTPSKNQATLSELRDLRDRIRNRAAIVWSEQAASFVSEIQQATLDERGGGRDDDQINGVASKSSRLQLWLQALGAQRVEEPNASAPEPFQDIRYLTSRLANAKSAADLRATWQNLMTEWQQINSERHQHNEQFDRIADLNHADLPAGWIVEGDGLRTGFVKHGVPRVSLSGPKAIEQLLRQGYHTHALSSKLPGALRLPTQQQLPGRFVSLALAGGEWSGYIRIPDNAFQSEDVKFLRNAVPKWHSLADVEATNGIQRVTYEISTSDLNPNFPPRTGIARDSESKLSPRDDGFEKRSWFSLTGIVSHDTAGTPADELSEFANLWHLPAPEDRAAAWQRIGQWLAASVNRFTSGSMRAEDVSLVNWLLKHQLLMNELQDDPTLAALVKRYRQIETTLAFARTSISMDERLVPPRDYALNVLGDIDWRGEEVSRDFLEVFAHRHQVGSSPQSGRLELAAFLTDPMNGFAARVYVNRVWQWIFGRGLVATPNDFGQLANPPSHPELLDALTCDFIADGWSTKQLIRRLVLSHTFRQSGDASAMAHTSDPDNRLWHHMPTRRLEAEAVRDSLLAAAGRLDGRLFGKPINPRRQVEDAAKRLFSGPVDGQGRRSIYLKVSIMDRSKFLQCFNAPDPKLPTGRRDATNVPAQALMMLNNPFTQLMAQTWSEQLVRDDNPTIRSRIEAMHRQAIGRPPQTIELDRWETFAQSLPCTSKDRMFDREVWKHVAHTMFNLQEFIHYR